MQEHPDRGTAQRASHPLRRARLARNLTIQALAERTQVSEATIKRAESGQRVSLYTRQQLCGFFEQSPEELGLILAADGAEAPEGTSAGEQPRASGPAEAESETTMKRRQVLSELSKFGLGAALLGAAPLDAFARLLALFHDGETLELAHSIIPISWRLYFEGILAEALPALNGLLSRLALIAREPGPEQQRAAALASQGNQLLSLYAQDYLSDGQALLQAERAIQEAQIAGDEQLLVGALLRKGHAYRFLPVPARASKLQLEVYEEARQHSSSVSPLLRGRLYNGLAEAHSRIGQEYAAQHWQEQAYKVFPEHPEDDPAFAYTFYSFPERGEANMYLHLGQGDRAWTALEKLSKIMSTEISPDRVFLLYRQAHALFLKGDMPSCCEYLSAAINTAHYLGAARLLSLARRLYEDLLKRWPHESRVKAVGMLL